MKHYKISWMGDNGRYYEKTGLSAKEMRKFIKRKGWENDWTLFGAEIQCEEYAFRHNWCPGAFMKYIQEEQ